MTALRLLPTDHLAFGQQGARDLLLIFTATSVFDVRFR